MKSYIPHRILIINEHVQKNENDPVFFHLMKLVFQWSNDMGIENKKVFGLHLQEPDPYNYSPLQQHKSLWCKIECTQEERKQWDDIQEMQIRKAVHDMLKEDE